MIPSTMRSRLSVRRLLDGLAARRSLGALAVLALTLAALAPPHAVLAQTPQVGGFLSLDRRFRVGDDSVVVADFYNRLRPELSVAPSDGVYLFASLDIRAYDFPATRSAADLEDPVRHFPTEITLWEGYVQLWDFLVDGLDVRVGRQRIQWGTADKLNPTDVINAYDFSDLVNFTDRVPTWAARAEYYVGGSTVTAVWSPTTHPPLMPRGGGAALFFGGATASLGEPLSSLDIRVEAPSSRLSESLGAIKVAGTVAGVDWSVSYTSGNDGIPFTRRVDLRTAGDGTDADGYDGVVTLGFTRVRTFGADFATEVAGVGVWGEAALVFPRAEERVLTTTVGSTTTEQRQAALDGRAFARSTVGRDYTFPGGWYANAQWAHGLFFEQGADALHDYFVGRVERSFRHDEVKVALGGAGEVATWSGASDNVGYGVFPELTYAPSDNVEVLVGAFLVGGRGASVFGAWDATDQIYTRFKVSF